LWFDPHELEPYLEAAGKYRPPPGSTVAPALDTDTRRPCSACDGHLAPEPFQGLLVHRCAGCGGVFITGAELSLSASDLEPTILLLLFAPASIVLVLSLLARSDLRRHPEKKGQGCAIFALVTGIAGTVVVLSL
jgi:hypothetical protein